MKISQYLDKTISAMQKAGTPAEHIIMGKKYFYDWIIEQTRTGEISLNSGRKKYGFTHGKVKIIVCESEILEVVPNPRYLLE